MQENEKLDAPLYMGHGIQKNYGYWSWDLKKFSAFQRGRSQFLGFQGVPQRKDIKHVNREREVEGDRQGEKGSKTLTHYDTLFDKYLLFTDDWRLPITTISKRLIKSFLRSFIIFSTFLSNFCGNKVYLMCIFRNLNVFHKYRQMCLCTATL